MNAYGTTREPGAKAITRQFLGLDVVGMSVDDVVSELVEQAKALSQRPYFVVTLNAEIAAIARRDKEMITLFNHADLVLCESYWVARCLGFPTYSPGVEVVQGLLNRSELRLYLLGGTQDVNDAMQRAVREDYPAEVVGAHHGYFAKEESLAIVDDIENTAANLVLVALGSPKQERWIFGHLKDVPCVAIGVGGTFDIIVGAKRRAPRTLRQHGFEWLYRMGTEPRRLQRVPRIAWFAI